MKRFSQHLLPVMFLLVTGITVSAQDTFRPRYVNSTIYTGIEVGAKGVKMSVVEIGKNAQSSGAFNILKDTSVNTDFISFTPATFAATLNGLSGLYYTAEHDYGISSNRIYTVVSSGVKMQAEKDDKAAWIRNLVDSFKVRIDEPARDVEIVDVTTEAYLSHLGIVPENRRFNTFLIDIGSGNTKGGFFPEGNTKNFRLFQLNWGTKSTANAAEKRLEDDKSLANFSKQLFRVLTSAENNDIIYSVNASGSYPLSDNIAISGGIAWSVATLIRPEAAGQTVVPVTYQEVAEFADRIYTDYGSLNENAITAKLNLSKADKDIIAKEVKRVNVVFDQKSLMAGTGLLLKIMRQFSSAYETKQFFLIKNGQVGWISAYVDQHTSN